MLVPLTLELVACALELEPLFLELAPPACGL